MSGKYAALRQALDAAHEQDSIEALANLKYLAEGGLSTERAGNEPMTNKYASLRQALDAAHEQASQGKGKERHARDGQPFTEQPIMAITRMVGLGYPCGQAMKKLQEAVGMAERGEHEAARREMLGAINYAAAAWLRVGEMVDGDVEGADDAGMDLEINFDDGVRYHITTNRRIDVSDICVSEMSEKGDESPMPWDELPDDFGWITRDGDGTIQAWTTVRPSLTTNAIWISGFGKCLRLRCPDDGEHEPKIWKRPVVREDDKPPVPWEYAPPRVKWFTRDANGAIDAWTGDQPSLERGAVWCGNDIDLIRWRPSDGDKHEPKIWDRPE